MSASRWHLLVTTPGASWSVELASGKSSIVGQSEDVAVSIPGARLTDRHLSLLPREEGVVVEPLRGGGETLINDVPIATQAVVRSGDEVAVGDARLIFSQLTLERPGGARITSEDEFMHRLDEESRRAHGKRPLGLVLVSSPHLNVAARQALTRRVLDEVANVDTVPCIGQLSIDLLAVSLPEASDGQLDELFARLPQMVGPRAQVTSARAPLHGFDAEALLGECFDVLLGAGARAEPVFTDPVMVRLGALAERLADDEGAVCLVGASGSGRRTLAELIARTAGHRLNTTPRGADWALLTDADRLARGQLEAVLKNARARVIATATRVPAGDHFAHTIEVPPLSARAEDVLPLAEHFVSRFRAAVGRPRLTLSPEARALLQAWHWPGNVRELVNVLFRAARATARDEIGRDALPQRLSGDTESGHFRGAMAAAERELLLDTLARTRWNVTAAATRLGMPRRTIVHRMAKLGLKRPAR
ncbi:MAG: helix-turn-helix domain-containing protein [Archangium sp.]